MAYNTKPIVTDVDGNPISQYYNKTLDQFEPVEGESGANKVVLYNKDGTENNSLSLVPILDKLSQLTGTVIDEETRKSNELQRVEFYNQLQQLLANGELKGEKGDKGDTGIGLNFLWQETSLGVKLETDIEYIFVDLRGPQGPPGDIDNLTSQHIEGALGYTPANETDLANKVDNDRVLTNVPANAKFTDTVFSGNYNDLSNKPTIPDTSTLMPISGGVLENYREKLVTLSGTSTSIDLNNGNVFTHTLSGNTTYSITNVVNGQAHSFTLIVNMGSTVRTLTFPASVKWQGGEIPDMSTANKTYVLTFMTVDGGTTWLGMFGGEF